MSFVECMKYRQTWAFAFGKFMTDGVWWFFLFWTPAYLKAQYGMVGTQIAWPIAVLYTITVFGSVFGGKFPTYFINRGMNPYAGRMRAMLIIAFFPLVVLLAQPLGYLSYWGADPADFGRGLGAPGLVGKHFFDGRRYVSA